MHHQRSSLAVPTRHAFRRHARARSSLCSAKIPLQPRVAPHTGPRPAGQPRQAERVAVRAARGVDQQFEGATNNEKRWERKNEGRGRFGCAKTLDGPARHNDDATARRENEEERTWVEAQGLDLARRQGDTKRQLIHGWWSSLGRCPKTPLPPLNSSASKDPNFVVPRVSHQVGLPKWRGCVECCVWTPPAVEHRSECIRCHDACV